MYKVVCFKPTSPAEASEFLNKLDSHGFALVAISGYYFYFMKKDKVATFNSNCTECVNDLLDYFETNSDGLLISSIEDILKKYFGGKNE